MFIGIDPSLSGTAVACYGGEVVRITSESTGQNVKDRMIRYDRLAARVLLTISGFGRPKVIFIEGYSFGSKGSSFITLAEYGGVLRNALCIGFAGVPIIEVSPSSMKKFITGSGGGKKIGVIGAIASKYGVTFESDDEYDAFGLALMAAAYGGAFECTNQAQRDVIEALKAGPKPKKRKPKAA